MNVKLKILACYGNVNPRSAAIMCNCTREYVWFIYKQAGWKFIKNKYNR